MMKRKSEIIQKMEDKILKKKKLWIAALLSLAMVTSMVPVQNTKNVWAAGEGSDQGITGGQQGDDSLQSEMMTGNSADISLSNVSVSGSKAGGKVKVSFTVTGNKNNKKHYDIESIEKIYPVLDDNFPFVMDNEAYRVTNGNGGSVNCSYTFRAKDNLETAYYMAGFTVVYTRKSADGVVKAYDSEYSLNKSINVKITGKPKATEKPADKQETAKDADISLKMKNDPYGVYGGSCSVAFTASSRNYKIKSVVPVIDNNFPFESTTDAYKVVRSGGTKSLSCSYHFKVKNNVSTGYQGVVFRIGYVKNGQDVTEDKTVNVELKGKAKEKTNAKGKTSTPRVMVSGFTTDVKTVHPNAKFLLTLELRNNASQTVHNIKLTMSTENGEFLPLSGASTAYLDSIAAKSTAKVSFWMKAAASLSSKSYQVTVKTEYEDGKASGYNAEDHVSIPVVQKDRISLTEVTPPDMLSVGGTGDLSFSINNLGGGALNNVSVICKGKEISCEKSFVGNIAAGATGYATVTLNGDQATPDDSDGECTIIVKYENASGQTKKYTEKTNVFVSEDMGDADMPADDGMDETQTKKGLPLAAKIGIGVAALVVVIIVVRIIVKKKRKKKEEELMDDELL